MEKVRVAKELLKMARSLVVATSTFTVMRALRLKKEGSTRASIENAKLIKGAGYRILSTELKYDFQRGNFSLKAEFFRRLDNDTQEWTFEGVNFGYGGEGPRGLVEFSEIFGLGLNKEKILGDRADSGLPDKGKVSLSVFK